MSKKWMFHIGLVVLALAIVIYPRFGARPDDEKTSLAATAAQEFLSLVDNGNYDESWQVTSLLLKKEVPREEWISTMNAIRTTSGTLHGRKLTRAHTTTMSRSDDEPEYEYIVLTYVASFTETRDAKETVTVVLDEDRIWRVAGYYLK